MELLGLELFILYTSHFQYNSESCHQQNKSGVQGTGGPLCGMVWEEPRWERGRRWWWGVHLDNRLDWKCNTEGGEGTEQTLLFEKA